MVVAFSPNYVQKIALPAVLATSFPMPLQTILAKTCESL